MKAKEVLKLTNITRRHLSSLIKQGQIRVVVKPNGQYDYNHEDVYKYIGKERRSLHIIYARVSTIYFDMALIIHKVGRLYSIIAINILTIAALLFVLNTMVFTAIEVRDNLFPPRSLTDLQVVYPGMDTSEIALLLEETWARPWQYEPWLGFKERPRTGKFV